MEPYSWNLELVQRYHDLLDVGDLATESAEMLIHMQHLRGTLVGGRPVCNVLRPRFLSPTQYRYARQCADQLLPAFQLIAERALRDDVFRQQLRLHDWEEELLSVDQDHSYPITCSRLDGFFASDGSFSFTEYNAESPAGAAYVDTLSELFTILPIMQRFQDHCHMVPVPNRGGIIQSLLSAYRQWPGSKNVPLQIAIVDWHDVTTAPEFALFADYFRGLGIACQCVDPRELEFANGTLRSGNFAISLVYRRVLLWELIERCGCNHPLIRAVREDAVCVANGFRSKLLARKATFAILSDERNRAMFSDRRWSPILHHIPWTRVLEPRHTEYHGETIELIPYVRRNRDRFVLKPNQGSGGAGVIIGANADSSTWDCALTAASTEPWVAQERISATVDSYPTIESDTVRLRDRVVDTGLFIANGAYTHGCLTRLSCDPIVNVAGGGAAIPTYLVEPRR